MGASKLVKNELAGDFLPRGQKLYSPVLSLLVRAGSRLPCSSGQPLRITQVPLVFLVAPEAEGGGSIKVRQQRLITFAAINVPDCLDQKRQPVVRRRPPAKVRDLLCLSESLLWPPLPPQHLVGLATT